MSSDDDMININKASVLKYLNKLKDKELASHYTFNEELSFNFSSGASISEFLKCNKPIKMSFKNNCLYYSIDGEDINEEVFDIDVENSFVESDKWLYDKIVRVEMIFPNVASSKISNEMSSLYICLVAASVFGNSFEDELNEVISTYDFKNWVQTDVDALNFSALSSEWIQLGSKSMKMVCAAAKYALVREKSKKQLPSLLDLPEEMALKLSNLNRKISDVRYLYDEVKLSPVERSNLSKLDVKILIGERDSEIQKLIESDKQIHQLWRLTNLNSNVIDPGSLRNYILVSRKESIQIFGEIYGRDVNRENINDKMLLKKLQNKLKKEAIRATLNKIFVEEVRVFKNDPTSYVAPNFV